MSRRSVILDVFTRISVPSCCRAWRRTTTHQHTDSIINRSTYLYLRCWAPLLKEQWHNHDTTFSYFRLVCVRGRGRMSDIIGVLLLPTAPVNWCTCLCSMLMDRYVVFSPEEIILSPFGGRLIVVFTERIDGVMTVHVSEFHGFMFHTWIKKSRMTLIHLN